MARLELDGLSACAPDGTAAVLHEISLAVEDGELLTVLGPAGSGKTTLLRTLIGLAQTLRRQAAAGRRADANDWAPAERDMAMVYQDHAPYPHLRVRDNLALPLRLPGRRRARCRAGRGGGRPLAADRAPRPLAEPALRRATAAGRARAGAGPAGPVAYLLDEPLSVDPALRGRLRALIAGTTTVWVTPDVAEAAAVGDRVAVLRDGRLASSAPRRTWPSGRPAWTSPRWPGADRAARLDPGRVAAAADRHAADRPAATGTRCCAGIRPADLRPDGDGVRLTLLAGDDGVESTGTVRLRHPALSRAAEQDPAVSAEVLARVDPAGRRAVPVVLDPARVLLFDPETGARPRGVVGRGRRAAGAIVSSSQEWLRSSR